MSHAESRATSGNISNYVNAFNVRVRDRIAALFRVSTLQQGKRSSLRFQETLIPKLIQLHGGVLVHQAGFEWSGRGLEWIDKITAFFDEALNKGATKVVALSADRYLRSRLFDGKANWDFTPTDEEWREVKESVGTLELQSIVPPRFTPSQVREVQTEWGQLERRKGGRPLSNQDERREIWLPYAITLRLKEKKSLEAIAKAVSELVRFPITAMGIKKALNREGIPTTRHP